MKEFLFSKGVLLGLPRSALDPNAILISTKCGLGSEMILFQFSVISASEVSKE